MPTALVESLDLVVSRAAGLVPGERRAPGLGRGTELAQLRPYQHGDDPRWLDAAASARTGIPHVRLHVPERAQTTWMLLDVSASMAFGSAKRLKADVAEGVALVVGRLAVRRGGRLALLTCGGARDRFLAPRGGRSALVAVRRAMQAGLAADGEAPERDLAAALRRTGRLARQPGLIVVVSDFREGAQAWRRPLGALARRHTVTAVEVRDPRESALPAAGHLALVDPETGQRVEVDTSSAKLRDAFAAAEAARALEVRAALRAVRARHVVATTDGDWLRELGRGLGGNRP